MNNLKLITFLLIAFAVTATLSAPARPCSCKKSHPVLVKYRDQDGNVRMTMVKQQKQNQQELSSWGSDSSDDNVSVDTVDSSEEASDDESADLQQYAERDGPNDDSDDLNEKYNISDEDDLENAEVYNESDDGNVYGHPYNPNIDSSESSEEKDAAPAPKKSNSAHKKSPKPKPQSGKRVFVYKQPPIIVNPKATNVYIRSKPIVVRPPPLVVHQADPKPCNPIIKYQPPNIQVRPVIVRISKPKPTTTTTTTHCPTTTRKPKPCTTTKKPKTYRKYKKPTKKCGRSQKNKSQSRTVYYNQQDFDAPDHQYVKQYKNLPCHDDIYT